MTRDRILQILKEEIARAMGLETKEKWPADLESISEDTPFYALFDTLDLESIDGFDISVHTERRLNIRGFNPWKIVDACTEESPALIGHLVDRIQELNPKE